MTPQRRALLDAALAFSQLDIRAPELAPIGVCTAGGDALLAPLTRQLLAMLCSSFWTSAWISVSIWTSTSFASGVSRAPVSSLIAGA